MAFLEFKNVHIAGISTAVPKNKFSNLHPDNIENFSRDYKPEDFVASTGVEEGRDSETLCTSDLCYEAANRLLNELEWDRKEVQALVFVSQTPDYPMPCSACILQDKLGLSKECYAFDCTLGCSGWVYGISQVAALLQFGTIKRALLLTGEAHKISEYYPRDPLFGSAGTATALEYQEGAKPICCHYGTDGSGYDAIIIPEGGCRNPTTPATFEKKDFEGRPMNGIQAHMKGIDVFSFGISTAPKSIKKLAEHFGFDWQEADFYVFHQANKKMNDFIQKKMKLENERVPQSMRYFANTSSASIPLTIVTQIRESLLSAPKKLITCGFGVGLSWGTVAFETPADIVIPELIEVEELVEVEENA